MRRLAAAAVTTAMAAGGLAGPHLGAGAASGLSALHQVRVLLTCDARAIGAIGPAAASQLQSDASACGSTARRLASGAIHP